MLAGAYPVKRARTSAQRTMRLIARELARTFELTLGCASLDRLIEQVVDQIENDELGVFRPDDEDAFLEEVDESGALLVWARADLKISIREWLSVGCQLFRFKGLGEPPTDPPNKIAPACYKNNAHTALFPPYGEYQPLGPAAFLGEIILCRELEGDPARANFIVAHELTHVFDAMRFVVPAFMDWDTYRDKALQGGTACEDLQYLWDAASRIVDDYGTLNELEAVRLYWPTQAEIWFRAFRQDT